MTNLSCFIDFDGTIVTEDVAEKILERFAVGNWKKYEEEAVAGKYTLEECMTLQYQMIRGNVEEILHYALSYPVRKGFHTFLKEVNRQQIPSVILSAGLSFVIDAFIEKHEWDIDYISAHAELNPEGVTLEFPKYDRSGASDFKQYALMQSKKEGQDTIYIGDGSSDFSAIRLADHRFALKGSALSVYCTRHQLDFQKFVTFDEIIPRILDLLNS